MDPWKRIEVLQYEFIDKENWETMIDRKPLSEKGQVFLNNCKDLTLDLAFKATLRTISQTEDPFIRHYHSAGIDQEHEINVDEAVYELLTHILDPHLRSRVIFGKNAKIF